MLVGVAEHKVFEFGDGDRAVPVFVGRLEKFNGAFGRFLFGSFTFQRGVAFLLQIDSFSFGQRVTNRLSAIVVATVTPQGAMPATFALALNDKYCNALEENKCVHGDNGRGSQYTKQNNGYNKK